MIAPCSIVALGAGIVLAAAGAEGADAGGLRAALDAARRARADGLPTVAAEKLRSAIEIGGSRQPSDELADAKIELAQALIETGAAPDAARVLEDAGVRDRPDAAFWHAQALLAAGETDAAAREYRSLGEIDRFAYHDEAVLGFAKAVSKSHPSEAVEALGRIPASSRLFTQAQLEVAVLLLRDGKSEAAARLLDPLRTTTEAEAALRQVLLGRSLLAAGQPSRARALFGKVRGSNARLAAAAAVGAAEAAAASGDESGAEALIEHFVEESPRSPQLDLVFAKLDELYAKQGSASNAELKRWAGDETHPARAALAQYYLARNQRRLGESARSIELLKEFLDDYPRHPLAVEARLDLIRLELAGGNIEAAVRQLENLESIASGSGQWARVRYQRGMTNFAAGNFAQATEAFAAAAAASPALAEPALYNAAVSAMLGGPAAGGRRAENAFIAELRRRFPGSTRPEDFALHRALFGAGRGDPDSSDALASLAGSASQPAVRDRARFALAERLWLDGNRAGSSAEFARVSNAGGVPPERRAYFAVFLADDGTPECGDAVSAAAEAFLRENPGDAKAPLVRLKLGEVLARAGDYRAARRQFESAARDISNPRTSEAALFLAAHAAGRSMDARALDDAIVLYTEVAKQKGPLEWQARFEQALLHAALDQPNAALQLLETIVQHAPDAALKFASLNKQGDTLLAMNRARDAVAVWKKVADDDAATPRFRNEALTKTGAALERLGNPDAAIAAYYDAVNAPRNAEPEYFWYYKAGFEAARLLADKGRLKEAIALYEKVAASPGPRADEARDQAKRLRLENFIWEN